MKKCLILLMSLFVSAVTMAQTRSDSQLLREATFEDGGFSESIPDSLSTFGRTAILIGRQLTGECWFEPECCIFAGQAVKEFGVLPGMVITADRLTRCSRIGTSQHHHFSEDGRIHEGTEAYKVRKRRSGR